MATPGVGTSSPPGRTRLPYDSLSKSASAARRAATEAESRVVYTQQLGHSPGYLVGSPSGWMANPAMAAVAKAGESTARRASHRYSQQLHLSSPLPPCFHRCVLQDPRA